MSEEIEPANDTNNNSNHNETKEVSETPQLPVTTEELPSRIKINIETFKYLKSILEASLAKHAAVTEGVSIEMQLYIAMQFLTSGKHNVPKDITETAVNTCINNVVDSLVEIAPQFIKFPSDISHIQQEFFLLGNKNEGAGFPNVMGIIDCAHIQLKQPKENAEQYLNYNSQYSINVQFVCGSDLQIYNVFAAFPGSKKDSYIWQNSNLHHVLSQSNLNNYWLLGDSEYPQKPWLMTPIISPETPAEELYNVTHGCTWKVIERCIQILKTRFECLQSVLDYAPENVCAIIIACCVLHNICLQCDTTEIEINLNEEVENSNKNIEEVNNNSEGVVARAALIQDHFAC